MSGKARRPGAYVRPGLKALAQAFAAQAPIHGGAALDAVMAAHLRGRPAPAPAERRKDRGLFDHGRKGGGPGNGGKGE